MGEFSLGNIITIAINLVVLIVFIVRMDGRITFQAQLAEMIRAEIKDLKKDVDDHHGNPDIHFSLAVSNQVQKRTDEKFNELEKQLSKMDDFNRTQFREMNESIKKIAERK